MNYSKDLLKLCCLRLGLDEAEEKLLTALCEIEYSDEQITLDMLLELENDAGIAHNAQPAWIVKNNSEIHISSIITDFINEQVPVLPVGAKLVICGEEKSYGIEAQIKEIGRIFRSLEESKNGAIINIAGSDGSGREYLLERAAASMQMQIISIDADAFALANSESTKMLARAINAVVVASVLYGAIVMVRCPKQVAVACEYSSVPEYSGLSNPVEVIRHLADVFDVLGLVLYGQFADRGRASNELPAELLDFGKNIFNIRIPDNGGEQRRKIAAQIIANEGIEGEASEKLLHCISSVKLPNAVYIRYVKSIILEFKAGKGIEELSEEVGKELANESLKFMRADRKLDELKLPQKQREELNKICSICLARDKVLTEGGFRKKFTYGNGLSVLFYGAPGTGKTMAAQVIAGTLGKPLYRVELSQLINKYIGETQKNIGRIFDEAEKNDCVLLFDEADAIFSKRGEVADAQDRYSNAETAYLLQRMESYTGICVLTTNLLQNFDEAFRRRITYMINFPMPDAAIRLQLWNEIFPDSTAVGESVDRKMLADTFELSGAAIRNIAQHAALLAAAEGDKEVLMSHILDGIINEYSKTGKNLSNTQKEIINSWT